MSEDKFSHCVAPMDMFKFLEKFDKKLIFPNI